MPTFPHAARCAVSLCYDDSKAFHHQRVAPALERRDFRGTFYCTISSDPMWRPEEWRALAARGHELGNHTLFHPCRREPPERFGWLDPAYDFADYTLKRIEDELRVCSLVLKLLDGKDERTFGPSCGHVTVGRGDKVVSFVPLLSSVGLIAARGGGGIAYPFAPGFDLMQTPQVGGDGKTFAELRKVIEEARDTSGWANFVFHGVGEGTHKLFIDEKEHEALLDWLAANKETIWTAPAVEIAKHVKSQRG